MAATLIHSVPSLLRFLAACFILAASFSHGRELKISAAVSLSEAITEISALYQKEEKIKSVLNFGGSNVLARQIAAGAPCDLFFSADEATIDKAAEENLLKKDSITRLLGNSLVVIAPRNSPLAIRDAADLASPAVRRLALGDPAAVPAGVYARKWLEGRGLWKSIQPKVVATENVRSALTAVAHGNVDAGIVYRTDANISKDTRVVYQVPEDQSPVIVYPIAITRSTTDLPAAESFIRFLRTAPAVKIFESHGFLVLPDSLDP